MSTTKTRGIAAGGASTTAYVEDLVTFLSTAGIGLTAALYGSPTTIAVDTLVAGTSTTALVLLKPTNFISAGERLMIENGLKEYLAGDAIALSVADGAALTFNSYGTVGWSSPWQTWAYSKSASDSQYPKLSGTNNYGAGTQK